jgi:hypothetical protein
MTDYLNTYKTPIIAICATGIVVLATHYFGCPFSGGCPFSKTKAVTDNTNEEQNDISSSDSSNNPFDK